MAKLTPKHNPAQPRAAFVACRDSRLRVHSLARHIHIDPAELLIISRADDPKLRTIDDIVAALPDTVTLLGLDDAEYLLPEGERTITRLTTLLELAALRYAHRELRIIGTTGLATDAVLTQD